MEPVPVVMRSIVLRWRHMTTVALAAFLLAGQSGKAQEPIHLTNPSFEDIPRAGGQGTIGNMPIKGWYNCALTAFPGQTPPDIHPHSDAWLVNKQAIDGETFLGMVVREDDTWEILAQPLSALLEGGECYRFSIFLAKSEVYMGHRIDDMNEEATFSRPFLTPAVLRIWGGSGICKKDELLAESEPVLNQSWEEYVFKFEPKLTHDYIVLEAFYKTPTLIPYNGHLLIDNASAIEPVPCDKDIAVIAEERNVEEPSPPPVTEEPAPRRVQPPAPKPSAKQSEEPEVVEAHALREEQTLVDIERDNLTKGQTIQIKNLYFKADSSSIESSSYAALDRMSSFLKHHDDIIVEIGGHTNTKPPHTFCDSLSTARAREVMEYLVGKGVPGEQLSYKGYGKRNPLYPNDRYNREYQKMNQRVEIKILSLGG